MTLAKAQIRYLWKISYMTSCPRRAAHQPGQHRSQHTTTSSPTASKQPPKEPPPEVQKALLTKYENQEMDGAKREFPQRMLLGTEKILARVWWEIEIKHKVHAPIQLHELLANRFFDAAGNPNPLMQALDHREQHNSQQWQHTKVTQRRALPLRRP